MHISRSNGRIHRPPGEQTTVPADVRALVRVEPGARLVWSVVPDGSIVVRANTKFILDMAGMLKALNGKRIAIEEMNPLR